MDRFLVNLNLDSKFLNIFDKEIYHQIKNVLRLRKNDKVRLFDGKGNEVEVKIIEFRKDSLKTEILKKILNNNEPLNYPILYCSILKRENFEIVIQKGTEVGIKEFVPILCQRTVKLNFKRMRLEKIIKEAAEQSQRAILPVLRDPIKFEEAVELSKENFLNFFFDQSGEKIDFNKFQTKDKKIGIWIGPEGGWDEKEIKMAKNANFLIICLGKLTLRAETAAIVSSFIVSQSIL